MDNRGRASHTLWGLQAQGNKVILLLWVSESPCIPSPGPTVTIYRPPSV
jgi:hypothetical protein